jgi:hypothetical protein
MVPRQLFHSNNSKFILIYAIIVRLSTTPNLLSYMNSFRRDKITATALSKCIAHLVNHQIAHEILSLQLLTVLLEGELNSCVE